MKKGGRDGRREGRERGGGGRGGVCERADVDYARCLLFIDGFLSPLISPVLPWGPQLTQAPTLRVAATVRSLWHACTLEHQPMSSACIRMLQFSKTSTQELVIRKL